MRHGDLTNEQWAQLEPLLPPEKPHTGRPALDLRQVMNSILWVLRTGAPCRDLPERYGKWTIIYSQFQRWCRNGVWDRNIAGLQSIKNQEGPVAWESILSMAPWCVRTSTR